MDRTPCKHADLPGNVIGCALEVHNRLGNGFQEVTYQRALSIELDLYGITYQREVDMPVFYRGQQIGLRRVGFLINKLFSVELKAIIQPENVHLAQAINYLEAYKLKTGLLPLVLKASNSAASSIKSKPSKRSNSYKRTRITAPSYQS